MKDPVRIDFATPLELGEGRRIEGVTLARPGVAALRGLQLALVQVQDVSQLTRLIPRITTPALTPAQLEALDPADFAAIANQISLFFVSPAQMAQMLAAGQVTIN